jgi:UTP-glucose-1-phosphate uridylyltransferase
MLLELGFKEFYIIVRKDGERVKKYFEKKFKEKKINTTLLLNQNQNLSSLTRIEGISIYVFENDKAGIGDQILALKNMIKNRPFLRVYGDEYFGGEKEKVKKEIKSFVEYALQKIKKDGIVEVFAFIDEKIVIGSVFKGLGIEGDKEDGKIIKTNRSNFMITSLCMSAPEFLEILQSEKKDPFTPLNLDSPQIDKKVFGMQKGYGKVINIGFFSNINTPEDYFKLVSYFNKSTKENSSTISIKNLYLLRKEN